MDPLPPTWALEIGGVTSMSAIHASTTATLGMATPCCRETLRLALMSVKAILSFRVYHPRSGERLMRTRLFIAWLVTAGSVLHPQEPLRTEWIDAETGHRVGRLTDDAGGSTLYVHDNAFSPA